MVHTPPGNNLRYVALLAWPVEPVGSIRSEYSQLCRFRRCSCPWADGYRFGHYHWLQHLQCCHHLGYLRLCHPKTPRHSINPERSTRCPSRRQLHIDNYTHNGVMYHTTTHNATDDRITITTADNHLPYY